MPHALAMGKLRVAVVAPTLSILGGHSVQAARLFEGWRNDPDVRAWLVPINPAPPAPLHLALRVKYARTAATQATYWPLLAREIRRADMVHVFCASYSSFVLAALPAMLVARALRRPAVLNYHSGHAADHLRSSRLARAALRSADAIVVPSPFLETVFREFGLTADVVPNTIDTHEFRFRERTVLRPHFLSTRNLAYPYNVACTVRAFRVIQDHRPDATLTIVGSGKDERAIRALADELRLKNVTFTGRVDPAGIHRCYAEHDIYIQSPDVDNMPLSVLEAFASGLAVVSTDAGGVPTLLKHETHGLLTPVGDDKALAASALRLLESPELSRRLVKAARDACQQYTWDAVRAQWLETYRRTLAKHQPAFALSRSMS